MRVRRGQGRAGRGGRAGKERPWRRRRRASQGPRRSQSSHARSLARSLSRGLCLPGGALSRARELRRIAGRGRARGGRAFALCLCKRRRERRHESREASLSSFHFAVAPQGQRAPFHRAMATLVLPPTPLHDLTPAYLEACVRAGVAEVREREKKRALSFSTLSRLFCSHARPGEGKRGGVSHTLEQRQDSPDTPAKRRHPEPCARREARLMPLISIFSTSPLFIILLSPPSTPPARPRPHPARPPTSRRRPRTW